MLVMCLFYVGVPRDMNPERWTNGLHTRIAILAEAD